MREVWQFRRGRGLFRLRRLTLRLCMFGMLVFMLASILIGVRVFGLTDPWGIEVPWVLFWGCITLLAGGVICVAIADFRTVERETRGDAAKFWQEIAEMIAANDNKHSPKE
jgi:uncharacterized membrane protein